MAKLIIMHSPIEYGSVIEAEMCSDMTQPPTSSTIHTILVAVGRTRGLCKSNCRSIHDSCTTSPMGTAQSRRTKRSRTARTVDHLQLPPIRFRVLVIGRANAGKTLILQRVCETTESPTTYRGGKKVRGPRFCVRVRSYYYRY